MDVHISENIQKQYELLFSCRLRIAFMPGLAPHLERPVAWDRLEIATCGRIPLILLPLPRLVEGLIGKIRLEPMQFLRISVF